MTDEPTMTCPCGVPTHDEIFCDKCRAEGYRDLFDLAAKIEADENHTKGETECE